MSAYIDIPAQKGDRHRWICRLRHHQPVETYLTARIQADGQEWTTIDLGPVPICRRCNHHPAQTIPMPAQAPYVLDHMVLRLPHGL